MASTQEPKLRTRIAVHEVAFRHDVSVACQIGMAAAERLGFGPRERYAIGTSIAELATNLLVHAGKGVLEISRVDCCNSVGLELIAIDAGPGIPNVDLALQDGFTTAGGLGSGLPAVKRLMGKLEITSEVGTGTFVKATAWKAPVEVDHSRPPTEEREPRRNSEVCSVCEEPPASRRAS